MAKRRPGRPTLADLRTQQRNANGHTPRGMAALLDSIQGDGWIGALTVAADGEAIAGSARLEMAAAVFGPDVEPIVVDSDGTRPIVVRRNVAVMATGEHLCMTMRGVRMPAMMTTSVMHGQFRDDARARAEFLAIVGTPMGR